MIEATLQFYPKQANANGTRGVWRVRGCRPINFTPHKRAFVTTVLDLTKLVPVKVMRVLADREYKRGSRVSPRRILSI